MIDENILEKNNSSFWLKFESSCGQVENFMDPTISSVGNFPADYLKLCY